MSDIKWKRKSGRMTNAGELKREMEQKLVAEAYQSLKPGQLVRVIRYIPGVHVFHDKPIQPSIEVGEILMYLDWVDKMAATDIGDPWLKNDFLTNPELMEKTCFTGPRWLFRERIHLRTLYPNEFEVVEKEEE